jgi:hypothetical protein
MQGLFFALLLIALKLAPHVTLAQQPQHHCSTNSARQGWLVVGSVLVRGSQV